MRKLNWLYIGAFVGILSGGLILTQPHLQQKPAALESYALQIPREPIKEDTLEYHLMMADLAWQRQLWTQAATHYAVLAQNTARADFALLATSAALEAQLLPVARKNAQLWAEIEPMNSRAQALTATLCFAEYNEELAYTYLTQLMEYTPDEALPHLMMINETLQDPKEQHLFFSVLQRLSTQYQHQPGIWFALARQAQTLKYYALALSATDHSLALQPDWVSAIALRVQILYQMGEKVAARDYLADVTKKLPEENDLKFIYEQIKDELQIGEIPL